MTRDVMKKGLKAELNLPSCGETSAENHDSFRPAVLELKIALKQIR